MLEVRGLTKYYSAVPAVDEVSFTVRPGEVLGYLGPNGSGKSTTVKMIAGLLEPTRGQVLFHGRNIQADLCGFKSRYGYVPEEPYVYPYLTGREYLLLAGRLRCMPEKLLAAKADALLRLLGLESDRHSVMSSYSKGMRQKVLIAAALLHDPQVVILDEPCSGLDVESTLVLRSLVRTLAEQGKVIVYSSHVLDMVEKICSDVIILHHGQVAAQDTVDRLRELASAASLEQVFAGLAVDANVDGIGRDLAAVGRL